MVLTNCRMGWLTCTRYLQLEKDRAIVGTTAEAASVASYRQNAYTPVAVLLLKCILDCSDIKFANNAKWMVPLLSQLILCNDPIIRVYVSNIYIKHIDPIILATHEK